MKITILIGAKNNNKKKKKARKIVGQDRMLNSHKIITKPFIRIKKTNKQ